MRPASPPMPRGSPAWLLIALLLAGAVACGPKRSPVPWQETDRPGTPESIYQALIERDAVRWSLQGTARARLDTGDRRARLDVTLFCQRPGSLRFDANDFFDHLLFLAVVHEGVFSSFSVPDNLYARGEATAERIAELVGVPLAPESLVALLLGSPLFVPLSGPTLRLAACEEADRLRVCDGSGDPCITVWVDRLGRPVESVLERGGGSAHDAVRVRVTFSRYRSTGTGEQPFRIRVADERTGRSFRLDFEEQELNREPPEGAFRFEPPGDARWWTW